ncbi:response regulator transcription factor [Anaeromicropila populeti]|uniref:Stage 0 sporulation protein A homolog n=1 Tax=Anaeromicropila populeti TaxID=37658 RepID=A0A1I6K589_9FIRM|nr:response regulator [Anaeromicropila populeti]SFR86392.1 two-component system, response regulator YesN [Anaeromicropila populeti]
MLQVLIVDDEPYVRQGLKVLIDWEENGYEIGGEAQNGLEAIEVMKKKQFDVVLVDIKMPKMDGLEFITYMRENTKCKSKFVIVSGYSEFTYAKEAMKLQVEHYLLKPIEPDELIQTLKSIKEDLEKQKKAEQVKHYTDKIVVEHYLLASLSGRNNEKINSVLNRIFTGQSEFSYIHLEIDSSDAKFSALSKEEKTKVWWELYQTLVKNMGRFRGNVICNFKQNNVYELGILVSNKLLEKEGCEDEKEFIEKVKELVKDVFSFHVMYYIGQKVNTIQELHLSYESAFEQKANDCKETDGELLTRIEEEIHQNYQGNLSLKELSEKYFMNSAYLGQVFKKKYGVYFKDYLNSIRIQKATELLISNNEKVYRIAEMVGYNNVDHFINKFTQEMGMTPNKYRMMYREKN